MVILFLLKLGAAGVYARVERCSIAWESNLMPVFLPGVMLCYPEHIRLDMGAGHLACNNQQLSIKPRTICKINSFLYNQYLAI